MMRPLRGLLAVITAWLALITGPVALAQTGANPIVVQAVSSGIRGGAEVVRIVLNQPVTALPQVFSTQSPARLSIDLAGVGNGLGRTSVELGEGNARSVRLVETGERLRLVVNLRQAVPYMLQWQDRTLLVVLEGAAGVSGQAPLAPASVRDIDFLRTADRSGRVVVSLAPGQTAADVRQQGKGLLVEFPRASLPEPLRRRLDVSDFGTPVQSVASSQVGDRVNVYVEPRGTWEHIAYQADDQFVLEVRATRADPNKLSAGPGYTGEKRTLNFQSLDVRSALQVIADFTNFNVVTSDTVSGTIMLRLKDVPWDQALDIIMQSKGLGMRRSGNVLWIAPRDELSAREQVELEARKKLSDLEPLRTQPFQLNYTKADDVARSLAGQAGGAGVSAAGAGQAVRILSSRGSVMADARTNQLFVTDIPSKLEEVQLLISRIDIPVRQVLIEARIVEADDSFGRALGVRLRGSDLRRLRSGVPG